MPITFFDQVIVCAASRPDDDVSTVGGAADPAARPIDNQPSAASDIAMVSDGTDTRSVTLEYEDAGGEVQTAVQSLSGTTEVTFGASTADILRITAASADANRTVTIREGAGGVTLHTLNPNETEAIKPFRKAEAGDAEKDYQEKYFLLNNGDPVRLLDYAEFADPDAAIAFALEGVVNGTGTTANRLTAPGLTFDSSPKSGGDLGTGDAQGIWYRQTVAAGAGRGAGTWTTRVTVQAA